MTDLSKAVERLTVDVEASEANGWGVTTQPTTRLRTLLTALSAKDAELAKAREEALALRSALQTAVDAIALYLMPSAMDGGIGECAAVTNAEHAKRVAKQALGETK